MTESKSFRPFRIATFIASLFGAMCTAWLLPAYGQQEIDPTWHDPWAAPRTAVASPPKAQPFAHRYQRTVRSVTQKTRGSSQGAGKMAAKATPRTTAYRASTVQAEKEH